MKYQVTIEYHGLEDSALRAFVETRDSAVFIQPNMGIWPSFYDGKWYSGNADIDGDVAKAYRNSTIPEDANPAEVGSLFHTNVPGVGIPDTLPAFAIARFPAFQSEMPLRFKEPVEADDGTKTFDKKVIDTDNILEFEFYMHAGRSHARLGFVVTDTSA